MGYILNGKPVDISEGHELYKVKYLSYISDNKATIFIAATSYNEATQLAKAHSKVHYRDASMEVMGVWFEGNLSAVTIDLDKTMTQDEILAVYRMIKLTLMNTGYRPGTPKLEKMLAMLKGYLIEDPDDHNSVAMAGDGLGE